MSIKSLGGTIAQENLPATITVFRILPTVGSKDGPRRHARSKRNERGHRHEQNKKSTLSEPALFFGR